MAVISLADGAVSLRYKSNINLSGVNGAATNGDYIFATVNSPAYLLMFNLATHLFACRTFSGNELYGLELETTTGR